jgi:hypothetical protein
MKMKLTSRTNDGRKRKDDKKGREKISRKISYLCVSKSCQSPASSLLEIESMTAQYQPLEQEASSSRSIDDYLETVYQNSSSSLGGFRNLSNRWRYYIIFLALGIANSGDSAEMGCMNFLLSSERFQKDVS